MESQQVEYKRSFGKEVIISRAAFANSNPGRLYGNLKLADLEWDDYVSSIRNKLLAEAFYLTGDIERYRTGFVTVHQKQGMCSLPRNCNRLPGAPDARKRPAMCASAHEQAADKADGVPGERLPGFLRVRESLKGYSELAFPLPKWGIFSRLNCGSPAMVPRRSTPPATPQ